jgi:hypothetical protein
MRLYHLQGFLRGRRLGKLSVKKVFYLDRAFNFQDVRGAPDSGLLHSRTCATPIPARLTVRNGPRVQMNHLRAIQRA